MGKNMMMPEEFVIKVADLLELLWEEELSETASTLCDELWEMVLEKIKRIKEREEFRADFLAKRRQIGEDMGGDNKKG